MPIVYLNGQFIEHMDAALDPLDRGVLFGDGLFETIRCEQGQLLFSEAHFARLGRGTRVLEIGFNNTPQDLLEISQQVLDANNLQTARLRVTVTRGEMHGTLDIAETHTAPTILIHAFALDQRTIEDARRRGYQAQLIQFPLNHRSPLAQVKSTSYQERVLARHRIKRDGFDEGIFLNTDGLVAEGTISNLFIIRGGKVITPPVEDGALPGIIRSKIGLLCGRLNIPFAEESLTLEDITTAEEAFLTNAIIEIMPMVRFGKSDIGEGTPGSITTRLQEEHRKDVGEMLSALRGG